MKKFLGLFTLIIGYSILEWLLNHDVLLIPVCTTIGIVLYIKYGKKINNTLKSFFATVSRYGKSVFSFIRFVFRILMKAVNLIYTLGFIYVNIKKTGLGISYIEAIKTASIVGNKLTIKYKNVDVSFRYTNKLNKMINRINRKISIKLFKFIRLINNSFLAIKPLMNQI